MGLKYTMKGVVWAVSNISLEFHLKGEHAGEFLHKLNRSSSGVVGPASPLKLCLSTYCTVSVS